MEFISQHHNTTSITPPHDSLLLETIQNQLECLYGIGISQRASDFLIDKNDALHFLPSQKQRTKLPKELLLVRSAGDETVEIALFLDQNLIHNLEANNPLQSINEKNLSDFCILIEGISHFVYFLFKAQQKRSITQLELELQAEIDKFLMLFFYLRADKAPHFPQQLFETLFDDYHLIEELSFEAKDRYHTASSLASHYCFRLQKLYRSADQLDAMVDEIRQFYQWSQEDKIKHIQQ